VRNQDTGRHLQSQIWDSATLGDTSASAWQARGRRFESAMLHPKIKFKWALSETDPRGPDSCLALVLALVMPRCLSDTGSPDPLPQTVSGVAQPLA
jgi:hypothetical protein